MYTGRERVFTGPPQSGLDVVHDVKSDIKNGFSTALRCVNQ